MKCEKCKYKIDAEDLHDKINRLGLDLVCRACRLESRRTALNELVKGLIDDKTEGDKKLKLTEQKLENTEKK